MDDKSRQDRHQARLQRVKQKVDSRVARRQLVEMADTVSEVQSQKHAFKAGVKAQVGIDW